MMKRLALCVVLIAGNAHGAACAKIEYAEAKDWSIDQLERQYCADSDASYEVLMAATRPGVSVTAANAILRQGDACTENAMMYLRIRENVHKKIGVPSCNKK